MVSTMILYPNGLRLRDLPQLFSSINTLLSAIDVKRTFQVPDAQFDLQVFWSAFRIDPQRNYTYWTYFLLPDILHRMPYMRKHQYFYVHIHNSLNFQTISLKLHDFVN